MEHPTTSTVPSGDFRLTHRQQLRNVAIYALTNGLIFLSAPVLYVGITQASLCEALGFSDTLANLPSSAFYCTTVVPIFVAWRFHTVETIKPVIVACYLTAGLSGLIMAALLFWQTSAELLLSAVIVHSAMIGGVAYVRSAFQWELVSRGISPELRGLAFSITFGVGPALAVVGSLMAQLILSGTLEYPWMSKSGGIHMQRLVIGMPAFPTNYALLFAATAPIMALAALLATGYVLPLSEQSPARPPFFRKLSENIRGLLSDRVLLLAVIAYLLVECGFTIQNNMTLYTQEALGKPAEAFAGYQNALRFSFKMVAGLFLGWLLSRTHAKMGMLVTGGFALAGVLWVLMMPHAWFLISFGLMGAGELYGAYYPNYMVNRSRPDRVRHNLALLPLLGLITSMAPAAFGATSDHFGLPASFVLAAVVFGASLTLIALKLPARPAPPA